MFSSEKFLQNKEFCARKLISELCSENSHWYHNHNIAVFWERYTSSYLSSLKSKELCKKIFTSISAYLIPEIIETKHQNVSFTVFVSTNRISEFSVIMSTKPFMHYVRYTNVISLFNWINSKFNLTYVRIAINKKQCEIYIKMKLVGLNYANIF